MEMSYKFLAPVLCLLEKIFCLCAEYKAEHLLC